MLSENDSEASIMKDSKMEDSLWCLIILDYIKISRLPNEMKILKQFENI